MPPAPARDLVPPPRDLAGWPLGVWARIVGFDIAGAERRWLEAIGLAPDEDILVLRRAPFRGPLHLRTSEGNELALDRRYAVRIQVAARGGGR